jgi:phosphoglycerol transferase
MALLFAFLPFHILRGQLHLPYAAYFTVPLGCTVALWVWDTPWTGRKYAIAMLICGVLSLDLPYWPFFTAFAISVAGMCAAFANKSMHPIAAAITLVSLIGFTSFLNVSPNLLYRLHHGSNTAALVRHPQEAEIYGLKIVQLMLPVLDHRFAPFRKLRERYDAAAPLVNENSTDTLGMIAAIGFCALILFAFIDRNLCARWPVWRRLVKLNLACVLLGTVGGLGSLLSFTLFDKIRGYNRVSVLIGFFALFAVGIMLTEICSRVPVWAAWVLCVAVVVFGVWDQTPPNYNFYEVNKARMANDGAFIKAVEAKLPKASMIFELPYQRYPEGGFVNRMRDYEPLSPYLYSERLRWSYGSIKGRAEDARERQVASSAATEMLRALVLRGFRGIYIDRDGYPDNARALEESFTSILNEQPMVSGDSRLSFFDLTRVSTQFEKEVDSPNGKLLLGNILSNLVAWSPGCYDMERDDKGGQRWCSGHAELELDNPLSHPLAIAIHMRLFAGGQSQAAFVMDGPSGRRTLTISSAGTPLEMNLVAQPGRQTIRVICDGTPVKASNDSRVMVFLVRQFYLLAK